jgi:hypothetical protein
LRRRGQRSEELVWDWLTEKEGKNQYLIHLKLAGLNRLDTSGQKVVGGNE